MPCKVTNQANKYWNEILFWLHLGVAFDEINNETEVNESLGVEWYLQECLHLLSHGCRPSLFNMVSSYNWRIVHHVILFPKLYLHSHSQADKAKKQRMVRSVHVCFHWVMYYLVHRNLGWHPKFPPTCIHILCNPLPLRIREICEYDGVTLLGLAANQVTWIKKKFCVGLILSEDPLKEGQVS